ncbi:MAG: hypothetical protein LBE91_11325 [Tannerella sp.]|jgi:natural product precursor|nr:hypothetical protein [Tannerella sp.]
MEKLAKIRLSTVSDKMSNAEMKSVRGGTSTCCCGFPGDLFNCHTFEDTGGNKEDQAPMLLGEPLSWVDLNCGGMGGFCG